MLFYASYHRIPRTFCHLISGTLLQLQSELSFTSAVKTPLLVSHLRLQMNCYLFQFVRYISKRSLRKSSHQTSGEGFSFSTTRCRNCVKENCCEPQNSLKIHPNRHITIELCCGHQRLPKERMNPIMIFQEVGKNKMLSSLV